MRPLQLTGLGHVCGLLHLALQLNVYHGHVFAPLSQVFRVLEQLLAL